MQAEYLLAAREEIKVHGLKFTMDDLTRRLHVSKTSLYAEVGSKDNLIYALVKEIMDKYKEQEIVILNSDITTLKKIEQLLGLYMSSFGGYSTNIFIDLKVMYTVIWHQWLTFQNAKINNLMGVIMHGIDNGEIRQISLPVLGQCLMCFLQAVNDYDFLQTHHLTYAEAVDHCLQLVLYGLKKD